MTTGDSFGQGAKDPAAWLQKYAPQRLDEIALPVDTRAVLESFLSDGDIPDLFFSGPPGIGKSTTARVLTDELRCATYILSASRNRGVEVIRGEVFNFVRGLPWSGTSWRIALLEEADGLTTDAQLALRNIMDESATTTRFILTANDPNRVKGPIRSRCLAISLADTPAEERSGILTRILEAEAVPFDPDVVLEYARRHTDIRQLLYQAETSARVHGTLIPLETSEALFGTGWTPAACDTPTEVRGASEGRAGDSRTPQAFDQPLEVHLSVREGHSTYRVQFSRESGRTDHGSTRRLPERAVAPASVARPHPAAPNQKGKQAKLSRILDLLREEPATTERLRQRLAASGPKIPQSTLFNYTNELEEKRLIASDGNHPQRWHVVRGETGTSLSSQDSENLT